MDTVTVEADFDVPAALSPTRCPSRRRRDRRRRGDGDQHRVPPGRGRRTTGAAARAGQPRLRVDLEGGRRRPGELLRRAEHRARSAQPGGVRATSTNGPGRRSICIRSAICSCCRPTSRWRSFEESTRLQNAAGRPTRMISVDEAVALAPIISPDGLVGACFSPDDGHCYAGVRRTRLCDGGPATRRPARSPAARSPGSMPSATTSRRSGRRSGRSATSTVICAAGAWSGRDRRDGRRRAAGDAAASADRRHGSYPCRSARDADDDRLQQHVLLPLAKGPASWSASPIPTSSPASTWIARTPGCPD